MTHQISCVPPLTARGQDDGYYRPSMEPAKKKVPAWLLGLVIATILFVLVVLVFDAFGIDDEPVVGSMPPAITLPV